MNERPARIQADTIKAGATAAQPLPHPFWTAMARGSTIGIFTLLLFGALYWSQPVTMPVVLALVAGIVLTPILSTAQRYGVPHWATALALVGVLFATLSYALVLLAGPIGEWIQKAPEFGALLKQRLLVLERPLAALQSLRESLAGPSKEGEGLLDIDVYAAFVRPMLGVLTPALGQIVVFFATLFFFLAGRAAVRMRFLALWGDREARLDALRFWRETEVSLARYFATVTIINAGLGLILAGFTWLIGFPNPIAWGVLAFLMNYIPYLGAAVVIVLLFGVGIMAFESLGYAMIAPVFYLVVGTIEGQFVTPGIVGLRLALSPLLVFISVAFWTWFWGPFGALLAVPLLIIGSIALAHIFPKEAAKLPA